MRDLYSVLGIRSTADQAAVQRAYHALMRRYHPDAGVEPDPARAQEINEAYHVLGDREKRRLYDARVKQERPPVREKKPPRRPTPARTMAADKPVGDELERRKRGISDKALFLWATALLAALAALLMVTP